MGLRETQRERGPEEAIRERTEGVFPAAIGTKNLCSEAVPLPRSGKLSESLPPLCSRQWPLDLSAEIQ